MNETENINELSERLNVDNIYKVLDGHEASLKLANHEMGAIKVSIEGIEKDVSWLTENAAKLETRLESSLSKLDNRLWAILSVLILGFLVQVALKIFVK